MSEMQTSSGRDPDAYVRQIRKALKTPDSEDERFRSSHFLREADAWLPGYIASLENPGRIILLHVKVMRALRDWERVIDRVRGEAWKERRVRARALLEAAASYTNLQEFASADRCLDEALKLDPGLAARVQRARKKLEDQLRLDMYGRLSALVYRAVAAGESRIAEHLYMSAAHVHGVPEGVATPAAKVLAALGGGDCHETRAVSSGMDSDSSRLVITCGSGYSGTGAVTAYLRELNGLPMPFGVRELAVLKKNYGLYSLLSKWDEWNPEARLRALQGVVLKALLGVPCYEDISAVDRVHSRSITWNSLFLGQKFKGEQASLLGEYSEHFVDCARNAATAEDLAQACGRYLNGILRIRRSRFALLNNCIHQTQIELCGLLENSRVIVVVRDPRDQFVAQQTETKGKRTTVEAFIKKRKRADAAVRKYLDSGRTNVRVFGFEAFVTDPRVREATKEWAGLAAFASDSDARFFYPEKSARNVGIHSKWKDKSEISLIERELKSQLVDS